MKPVRTRITESTFLKLVEAVSETGVSQSEFLRQALEEKLNSRKSSVSQS